MTRCNLVFPDGAVAKIEMGAAFISGLQVKDGLAIGDEKFIVTKKEFTLIPEVVTIHLSYPEN